MQVDFEWFREQFFAVEWDQYSILAGKISTLICIAVSTISIVFGFSVLVGIWTLFCGLSIAVYELPLIYIMIPECDNIRTISTNLLHLENSYIKGGIFLFLAIPCYLDSTLCIAAGVILTTTGLMFIFAGITIKGDVSDCMTTDDELETGTTAPGVIGKNIFGTF